VSNQGRKFHVLTIGIPLGLILLASSLAANIFGFNSLAQILSLTALVGAFAGTARTVQLGF